MAQMTGPYPDFDDFKVDDFKYVEPLITGRHPTKVRPGAQWVVWEDYTVNYQINGELTTLVVPKGTVTDFASVPRLFRGLVSKVGAHLEVSVVHDYLYEAWWKKPYRSAPSRRDQRFADKVFRAGLIAAKVPWLKRILMYQAVRRFGWSVFKDK